MTLFLVFSMFMASADSDIPTGPCTKNCVADFAIPALQKIILTGSKMPPSDSGCPTGGQELVNAATAVGKAATSSRIVSDLIDQNSQQRKALENSSAECGACKQKNAVTLFTTSAPAKVRTDLACANPFTRDIHQRLANSEIQNFAEAILKGKNPRGQKLAQDCPASCSYYVASGQTPVDDTASDIDMTIVCGPLREGNLILANYNYTLGFIHQWTCSK